MKRFHVCLAAIFVVLVFSATPASGHAKVSAAPGDKTATAESRFAALDGAKVHYVNYGKGDEALIFIHGWTCNLDHWRDQVGAFAKRNRVIAIDLPGHGQSDKPQVSYSMEYFASAVEAVMRDAKVKRAVLVGHSMGTPVARQFYRKYPEQTLAIVVVDGVVRQLGDKKMMDQMMAGFRGPNYKDNFRQMFAMMMGAGMPAEKGEWIVTTSLTTPQHVLVSAMEGMADPAIWGDDKINVPVLAIMAKNPFFPPNMEELFRELAPNLEFHMWDGVGHFIMIEKPREFNSTVWEFLDKKKLLQK